MKLLRWLLPLLLVAALAAAYFGWSEAGGLRAEIEKLKAENQSIRAENQKAAEAQSRQRDAEVQRLRSEAQEVHKLRNEVTRLRTGAKDAERLRAENQQLRASAPAPASTPAATAPPDNFPRDSWTFAGYATPEAALISAVSAMKDGRPQAYLDSLSPEEQLRMAKTWETRSEAEIAAKHQQDVSVITGVRILERQAISAGEMRMKVYIEGANRVETVSMKQVGSDWKFGGFIREKK